MVLLALTSIYGTGVHITYINILAGCHNRLQKHQVLCLIKTQSTHHRVQVQPHHVFSRDMVLLFPKKKGTMVSKDTTLASRSPLVRCYCPKRRGKKGYSELQLEASLYIASVWKILGSLKKLIIL